MSSSPPSAGVAAAAHRALTTLLYLTRRATTLRRAFDAVLQRPLTELLQAWARARRHHGNVDADLALAEERELPGERAAMRAITTEMSAFLRRHYPNGGAERAGNTKTYGLLEASLEVPPLPADLSVGLFARPATYPAWVRFAGPGPLATPDIRNNGVLSIGVKLRSVCGRTLLDEEPDSLDLTGISTPTFTTPNVLENRKLQRYIGRGLPAFYFLNPRDPHLFDMLMQALYARAHASPFETSYWSGVPYLFGPGRAFRYRLAPTAQTRSRVPLPAPDDYLREAMQRRLRHGAVTFDLHIQLQERPALEPVEDASLIWRGAETKVARLTIAPQDFHTPTRVRLARDMTINPWHTIAEHRPLGNQNRARRDIYLAASRVRHELNNATHRAPGSANS